MTKAELIDAVAEKSNVTKKQAAAVIESFTQTVTEVLKSGDRLTLIGFGTFETSKRAAREGRNPRTGETLKIPACVQPRFKAGASLKNALK